MTILNIKKKTIHFQNNTGDTLSINDFKNKYVILDCWYTYCGVCYQAFPKVEELYNKYCTNENVIIATLHARMEDRGEDIQTGANILKNEGYIIPCYSINITDNTLKEMGITVYPTVLIFDKKASLLFRGNIDNAEKFIASQLKEN